MCNYDNSSGKFLKRNFRVSKYCGANAADCFTAKYHKINGIKKEEVTPSFGGSCAILKSGAAICIKPQVGQDASDDATRISGYIDVNGVKGPNILDRDLRQFAIPKKLREVKVAEVEDVKLQPNPLLSEAEPDDEVPVIPPEEPQGPCDIDPNSLDCCKTYETYPTQFYNADIRSRCCGYTYISDKYPTQCGLYINVSLSCSNSGWDNGMNSAHATQYLDCILVTDDTSNKYSLDVKYFKTGSYTQLSSVNSSGQNQLSITDSLTGGYFQYTLKNLTTGEELDVKQVTGGYSSSGENSLGGTTGEVGKMELTQGSAQTGATAGESGHVTGLSYSYFGPSSKN